MSNAERVARDLVLHWARYLENIDDPNQDGEDLAQFIDLVEALPFDADDPSLQSVVRLLQGLNELLKAGLASHDHQIVLDAFAAAMRHLGEIVNLEVPDGRPH